MNSKTTITFGTTAIAAVALLFTSGPIVGNQQALAYVYHHGHYYHHPYYHHPYYHHPYYHYGHYYHHGHYYHQRY
ncbi:MAG: hypothetical protein WBF33_38950 [Candidatus Nitrosopolaris sp.]